jgi:uncharacterized membrane protein
MKIAGGLHRMKVNLQIKRYIITGLITILPVWVTVFVLWFVFKWVGSFTRPFLIAIFKPLFETSHVIMLLNIISFVLTLIVIYIIGFLTAHLVTRRILVSIENILTRIPLLRGVYLSARRLTQYLFSIRKEYRRVAMVEYPRRGIYAIGFITSDTDFADIGGKRMVNVFVPTAPNPTSGVLIVVPESDLIQINMKIEEAIRLIISGGIIQPGKK